MANSLAALALFSCALLMSAAEPAMAQEAAVAGRIKIASGSVFVIRGSAELPAAVGDTVFASDGVRTGADGRLGLTLKDETRVSLGPSSEVRIDTFRFAPNESSLAVALTFVRGVVGYVSGRIAKLAPDAVRLKTPSAIIGVRGTTLAVRVAS